MSHIGNLDLDKIIVASDKVLIKPKSKQEKTKSGIYLPPGVSAKEKIQSGYVIKVGPGYPIPSGEIDEPWKKEDDQVKYMPLQAKIGDLAIYLQNSAYEIQINEEDYLLIPNSAILMLFRDESLFK